VIKIGDEKLQCPCCRRDFRESAEDSIEKFKNLVKDLVRRISEVDGDEDYDELQRKQEQIEQWQRVVADGMNGVRDYWRIRDEVAELELEIQQLEFDGKVFGLAFAYRRSHLKTNNHTLYFLRREKSRCSQRPKGCRRRSAT